MKLRLLGCGGCTRSAAEVGVDHEIPLCNHTSCRGSPFMASPDHSFGRCPGSCSVATLASTLFSQEAQHAPASGLLHLPCLLPVMYLSLDICITQAASSFCRPRLCLSSEATPELPTACCCLDGPHHLRKQWLITHLILGQIFLLY